ncbi:DUF6776 family protein [Rhodanobacter sp. L36]|uniref:DUF6776 family protein n=1 Tax=Rhodanobacter sp. L36 TaxID=1747221 RepID=UPI00131DEFD4|nr:DUF6776 family protein [Rhodanobacter sp. L36]
MASRPPPRFVVRRHDDMDSRRRWLWLGAAWLGSLVFTAFCASLLARHASPAAVTQRQQHAESVELDGLKQQIANLQRAAQVDDVATRSLRGTLAQREEEISGLRADLGFYSRLVGGDAQRQGLKLQEVKLQPITGSRGWNLILSLTQNAKRGDETTGNVVASVEGLRGDKVVQLDWAALGDTSQKDGLPFHFMYFQQLQGTMAIPADFRPTQLQIRVQPHGEEPIVRTVAWGDALNGNIISTAQGNHDAQP